MDLNKVKLSVGSPAIQKSAPPNWKNVCSFSVATGFTWTDHRDKKKNKLNSITSLPGANSADIIGQYMKKGSTNLHRRPLQTTSWDDKTAARNDTAQKSSPTT
jgi:single-strand DNA-binding protein